jgi:hypothetical protein
LHGSSSTMHPNTQRSILCVQESCQYIQDQILNQDNIKREQKHETCLNIKGMSSIQEHEQDQEHVESICLRNDYSMFLMDSTCCTTKETTFLHQSNKIKILIMITGS